MKARIVQVAVAAVVVAAIMLSNSLLQAPYSYADYLRSLPGNDSLSPMSPPNTIPGYVFTGDNIRIGFNYGGTFGVGMTNPGTGFQYPIGPDYESLAIWTWAEGYCFWYETNETGKWVDHEAWWIPESGWPIPTTSNVTWVSSKLMRNDTDYAKVQTIVETYHGASTGPYDLKITFTCLFPKHENYVILDTTVQNLVIVRDPIYKRIVDWDDQQYTLNNWTSTSYSASADYYNSTLGYSYLYTVSAQTNPTGSKFIPYVDLYSWDDFNMRGPAFAVQSVTPLLFDGCAGIYFDLGPGGYILPKVIGDVYLYYEAAKHWP
jgi:hypothetical protein